MMGPHPERAARRGFSTVSLVATLIVVVVLSAAVVRVSWGLASGAATGNTPITAPGDEDASGATFPSGAPPEAAGAAVLSSHAAAIAAEASAAAQVNGVPVENLADDEIVAGYPRNDGSNTVTARVAARDPLRVQIELNGGTASVCVDVATGANVTGRC